MMRLSEGQMSDHKGAVLLFSALPRAKELLADKGYDSDWFRAALMAQGTTPCIPPRKNRKVQYHYDKELYRQRQDRERLRQNQGLAQGRNPLRPMRTHLHVRHLHRRNRMLLVVINES